MQYYCFMKLKLTIIGFVLFLFGMLALILSLVGLKLSFLTWIDSPGRGFGFLIRIIMIFGGMILFYVGRTLEIEE